MGFMAGFGEGFSKSFEAGNDRLAQQKQDILRMTFASYENRKKEYAEAKAKDTELVSQAKALVAGVPGATEEAWGPAYNWLKSGLSADKVQERIAHSTFAVRPSTPTVGQEQPTQPLAHNVQGQPVPPMAGEVQGQPINPRTEQPTAQEAPPEDAQQGGFLDQMSGIFNTKDKMMASANDQVRNSSGMTKEEWDQLNAGYTPIDVPDVTVGTRYDPIETFLGDAATSGNVAKAKSAAELALKGSDPEKAKAARVFLDEVLPNMPVDKGGDDDPNIPTVLNYATQYTKDYLTQRTSVISVADKAMALDKLISTNKAALTLTGGVANLFDRTKLEINTAIDVMSQSIPGLSESDFAKIVKDKLGTDENIDSLGTAAQKVNSQMIALIYAIGRTEGQSGQGFSNRDFDNIKNIVAASDNYITFSENLRGYIGSKFDELENTRQSVFDVPVVAAYMDVPRVKKAYTAFETPISDDPKYKKYVEWSSTAPTTIDTTTTKSDDQVIIDNMKVNDIISVEGGIKLKYLGGPKDEESSYEVMD